MSAGTATIPARRAPLVPNGVLGMIVFLVTEGMLFAALMSAYLVLRAGSDAWPPPGQPRLPIAVTGINTLVLLASGVTITCAIRAVRAGASAVPALAATAALGVLFLVVQGSEWARLIAFGLTTRSGQYGALFYTTVGAHAFHVLVGVIALVVTLVRARGGAYSAAGHVGLSVCRMYWMFVVGVWPLLYALVYLY